MAGKRDVSLMMHRDWGWKPHGISHLPQGDADLRGLSSEIGQAGGLGHLEERIAVAWAFVDLSGVFEISVVWSPFSRLKSLWDSEGLAAASLSCLDLQGLHPAA